MTVLFSDGFESPPNTPPNTFTAWSGISSGAPIMQNTTVHSGSYAMQASTTTDDAVYKSLADTNNMFVRAYVRFDALPNNNYDLFIQIQDSAFAMTARCGVATGFAGTPKFWTLMMNANIYNVADATIATNKWYSMEIDTNTDGTADLWVDGNLIKHTTGEVTAAGHYVQVGSMYGPSDVGTNNYVDDVVVADAYIGTLGPPYEGTVLTCLWKP